MMYRNSPVLDAAFKNVWKEGPRQRKERRKAGAFVGKPTQAGAVPIYSGSGEIDTDRAQQR